MTLYRGRFAPTPSGPLHFGSLFAAVVSYLDAKANDGQWLLRIEDIDPPREQAGASASILRTLEAHGLEWDETETYQSQNTQRYLENLDQLTKQQRLFWCQCSRKQLQGQSVYPGTCRSHTSAMAKRAIRFRVKTEFDHFEDIFQGEQYANLQTDFGDVILRRRDNLFSYQLAVVSDDIAQRITHVIRGIDLIDSVYWQRELYRSFEATMPTYGHFAVLHAAGSSQKLSKQNLAAPVTDHEAIDSLLSVFKLLDLPVEQDRPTTMLVQATELWSRDKLFGKQSLQTSNYQLDSK